MRGIIMNGGVLQWRLHFALLCLLLLVPYGNGGQLIDFTKTSYPDPQIDFSACGRSQASWVCDPGRYMTRQQADDLDANINRLGGQGTNVTIMIAVVPQIIGQDGKATSEHKDLKEFTNYLHQTKWKRYSTNILLILVYDTSRNAVWVQSESAKVTTQCICQLTYESQQFFTSNSFPTLLDIYTSKFRNVLSGTGSCSTPTDNVPWMVDAIGVCSWTTSILVNGMSPTVGNPRGGIMVNLYGVNFDLTMGQVIIGTMPCEVISRSSTVVKFVVAPLTNTQYLNTPMPVYLLLGNVKYDTGRRFIYSKPTLQNIFPTTTTIRGGLWLTVSGTHLDLVTDAIMLTTLTGKQTQAQVEYQTTCKLGTAEYIYCPTPSLELERVRPNSPARRRWGRSLSRINDISHERHRHVRAVGSDGGLSQSVDDVTMAVRMMLNSELVPLDDVPGAMLPISVYVDPILYPFEGQEQTVTFVSVWPKSERQMEIAGSGLLPVLKGHTVSVRIGDGVCVSKELFSNRVICSPPIYQPKSEESIPSVQAWIGKLEFRIGYLEYQDTLWKYPPTRYAIIGAAGAIVLLIIIVVCCCCVSKPRRRKKMSREEEQNQATGRKRGRK